VGRGTGSTDVPNISDFKKPINRSFKLKVREGAALEGMWWRGREGQNHGWSGMGGRKRDDKVCPDTKLTQTVAHIVLGLAK
jgi:hypothetical protein